MPVDWSISLPSDPGDPTTCVGDGPDKNEQPCSGLVAWRGRLTVNPSRSFYACHQHAWMLRAAEPYAESDVRSSSPE